MSNHIHGLTVKDESGKTRAHPLYWVYHEKRKNYDIDPAWNTVFSFVEWAKSHGWVRGDSIRRRNTSEPYGPTNCYVHVKGTPLGQAK
jgi:hypothetical protein